MITIGERVSGAAALAASSWRVPQFARRAEESIHRPIQERAIAVQRNGMITALRRDYRRQIPRTRQIQDQPGRVRQRFR